MAVMKYPRPAWLLCGVLISIPLGCSSSDSRAATNHPTTSATARSDGPRVFQSPPGALADARDRYRAGDPSVAPAVNAIRAEADKALKDRPFTIVHKTHPLPGVDVHDYVSIAPYFWPDTKSKEGLPYYRRDGERNPETREYDSPALSEMSSHVSTLALAGYLTGDDRYAKRAAELLRVWFFDDATRMNPNLNHAQLIKGQNDGRGTGIIESNRLLPVVDAIGMMQQSGAWSADDQSKIQDWFRQYVQWMRQSKNGKAEAAAGNNHGSWYDAQLATYLMFLGDDAGARQLLETVKENRIARQIEPSGEMPRELARTKSFHYSVFNLSALTTLADLGQRLNVDLGRYQTADGRSIRKALDWLIPFALNQKKWEHQQIIPLESHILLVPLRRAEAAYHEPHYEEVVRETYRDFSTDRDNLRFPATEGPTR
ncbi:MAG TPA: alginate lyase family protein [Tepidisphaeraceae bacterium]|nr:alginate lyase family protein [Tepidisphaeraceae bacterium]